MLGRLLFALWGLLVLSRCGPHLDGWADAGGAWRHVGFDDISPWSWLTGFLRHALALGLAALLVIAQLGVGWHLHALLRARRLAGWERVAVALLLGFAAVGMAGFGLACAGLFRVPLLVMVSFAGLALPGARRAVAALRSTSPGRPPGWWWWAVAPVGIAAFRALAPDTHVDTYTYHLATTEAWLKAGKLSLAGAGLPHHFPMTAECVAAIPVALGVETAVPFVQLAVFLAGVGLLVGRSAPGAGWLAAALGATSGLVLMHLPTAKNDLAAAGCLIGGVALGVRSGSARLAGVLLGCGCAIKLNGPPIVLAAAAWMLCQRGGVRRGVRLLAASAVMFLPWLAKAWLTTGDPVYPVLAPHLPFVPWDAESTRAVGWMTRAVPVAAWVGGFPLEFLNTCVEYAPGLVVILPVAVIAMIKGSGMGLAVIALADVIICRVLMPSEWYRLALPGFVILAASLAGLVAGGILRDRQRRPVLIGLALLGWLPLGRQVLAGTDAPLLAGYLSGVVPRPEYDARAFTTLDRARRDLAVLPGVRRVLLSGEIRSFRLPGRPLHERCWGRTHAWALAGASRTADDVARKIRQLGGSHLLYNVVTEQFPHGFTGEFAWDDRRLAVWKAYVARWTTVAVPISRLDLTNGAFVIFTLARRPDLSARVLPWLPGITGMVFRITAQPDRALERRSARDLAVRLPEVLHAQNLAGLAASRAGDHAEAYRRFGPGAAAGVADLHNFLGFARAAAHLGRRDEADRFMARAIALEPALTGRLVLSGTRWGEAR